jgi:CheY-like chemotaxis protein
MPKMSGIELVSKIREITPDIKVIYISGFFRHKKAEGGAGRGYCKIQVSDTRKAL